MTRLLSIFALSLLFALPALAQDTPLQDPAAEATARSLMKELRCLQCQNQSIDDSNADIARELRLIVREKIAAGESPDDVKVFLVERYGDWVLLRPPLKRSTWFLWASPMLLLLFAILFALTRRREKSTPADLSAAEKAKLARYMAANDGDDQ